MSVEDLIVICTGYGFKVVPAADLSLHLPDGGLFHVNPATLCPQCLTETAPTVDTPSASRLFMPQAIPNA